MTKQVKRTHQKIYSEAVDFCVLAKIQRKERNRNVKKKETQEGNEKTNPSCKDTEGADSATTRERFSQC